MIDRTDPYCTLSEAEISQVRHHLDRIDFQAGFDGRERQIWTHIDAIKQVLGSARDREFENPYRLRSDRR